ncbi:MAG: D-alanyl-D-alanine carboxypeptidase/D-alanyl-D-alanine-endopeptidase [Novosphingobium sp.]
MRRAFFAAALLCFAAPAVADAPPVLSTPTTQAQVDAIIAGAPKGTRFGLLVVDDAGNVIASVNPDQRFIPASNTKMFTTAAAYALMPDMDKPDMAGGTQVALVSDTDLRRNANDQDFIVPGIGPNDPLPKEPVDVYLSGRGDARMSGAADCQTDCLASLADAVAARTKVVRNVIGDDSLWPDLRWSPGMSWNNIGTGDGTAAGALNLDDNQVLITIKPGAQNEPPTIIAPSYFKIRNNALTVMPGESPNFRIERPVNGFELRVTGFIPSDSPPWNERIGVDDPAHFAAWTLRTMLEARGVKVTGKVLSIHRGSQTYQRQYPLDEDKPVEVGLVPLAQLVPPPLADDVVIINKVSQNLHAQVMFRRLVPAPTSADKDLSVQAEQALFAKAGIAREGYDFSDGSGMSTYNRVSPRAGVALLRWIDTQSWGKTWYASLPIAGVDGTLKRRFIGTPLANNLIAKTGTLNATNALSGTFRAASGKRLTFAFFANDVPDGQSAVPSMEAVLLAVAAAN